MRDTPFLREMRDITKHQMDADPSFRRTVYAHASRSPDVLRSLESRLRDGSSLDEQRKALEALQVMGDSALTPGILGAIRDLIQTSPALCYAGTRLVAEAGLMAVTSERMTEALLEVSGDVNAGTRRWAVAGLACVADQRKDVRQRLAKMALTESDPAVRCEVEAALAGSSGLLLKLMDALRNDPKYESFIELLGGDMHAIFANLYGSPYKLRWQWAPAARRTVPILGKQDDFAWSLVQRSDLASVLNVDVENDDFQGQILEIRERTTAMSGPVCLMILHASEDGAGCWGEGNYTGYQPPEPQLEFYVHDWREVTDQADANVIALSEYYEQNFKDADTRDRALWEAWFANVEHNLQADQAVDEPKSDEDSCEQ